MWTDKRGHTSQGFRKKGSWQWIRFPVIVVVHIAIVTFETDVPKSPVWALVQLYFKATLGPSIDLIFPKKPSDNDRPLNALVKQIIMGLYSKIYANMECMYI